MLCDGWMSQNVLYYRIGLVLAFARGSARLAPFNLKSDQAVPEMSYYGLSYMDELL